MQALCLGADAKCMMKWLSGQALGLWFGGEIVIDKHRH
jgi:hypothetical protein